FAGLQAPAPSRRRRPSQARARAIWPRHALAPAVRVQRRGRDAAAGSAHPPSDPTALARMLSVSVRNDSDLSGGLSGGGEGSPTGPSPRLNPRYGLVVTGAFRLQS